VKTRLFLEIHPFECQSLIRVPETRSTFHLHAQRNAFRRRDARQQFLRLAGLAGSRQRLRDPRVWRGLEVVVRDFNKAPGVQAWWRSHSDWFTGEEVTNFINQQQQIATRHDD
jgi:hypothetical protein